MTPAWRWRLARIVTIAVRASILIAVSLWTWAGLLIGLMRHDENLIGMCGSLTALGFLFGLVLAYRWAVDVLELRRRIDLGTRPTETGMSVDVDGRLRMPEGAHPYRDRGR